MKANRLLLVAVLAAVLAPATRARARPPAPYVDSYATQIGGEPVASVDVFYDQLAPYGVWVNAPGFGAVFVPDAAGYAPYTQGYWQYTNVGFVWTSAIPFEWATSHYGRWLFLRNYGRWAWRPDTVWGPAWVEWRQVGDYYGWAPLAPANASRLGYVTPFEAWHYCAAARIFDPWVARYFEPRGRAVALHRGSRGLDSFAIVGGARVVVGPSWRHLHDRNVDVYRRDFEPRAVGRWTHDEARAALDRARSRRAWNDEQNRRRLEAHPGWRGPGAARPPHHP